MHSRMICGRVLRPEDGATDGGADAAGGDQGRGAEGELPLSTDVVRLSG
jgi:hypothetical protein